MPKTCKVTVIRTRTVLTGVDEGFGAGGGGGGRLEAGGGGCELDSGGCDDAYQSVFDVSVCTLKKA